MRKETKSEMIYTENTDYLLVEARDKGLKKMPYQVIIDANILLLWTVPFDDKPNMIKDYLKAQGIRNNKMLTRHEIMEALSMKFELGYYPKNKPQYSHEIERIPTWGLVFPEWVKDWNNPSSLFKTSIDNRLEYLSAKTSSMTPIVKKYTTYGYGSSKGNYELVRPLTDYEKKRLNKITRLPPHNSKWSQFALFDNKYTRIC